MEDADRPVNLPGFSVEPLTAELIPAVVALHRGALGYSLNSRLGAAHLARLYAFMRQAPETLVRVAVRAGRPIGVISAALAPDDFKTRFLSSLTLIPKMELAARLASLPALGWEAWATPPVRFEGQQVKPCFTALAVAPEQRRAGVGRALVGAGEAFMRSQGVTVYHLDTRVENAVSRAFYRRLGFVEVAQRGRNVFLVKTLGD